MRYRFDAHNWNALISIDFASEGHPVNVVNRMSAFVLLSQNYLTASKGFCGINVSGCSLSCCFANNVLLDSTGKCSCMGCVIKRPKQLCSNYMKFHDLEFSLTQTFILHMLCRISPVHPWGHFSYGLHYITLRKVRQTLWLKELDHCRNIFFPCVCLDMCFLPPWLSQESYTAAPW